MLITNLTMGLLAALVSLSSFIVAAKQGLGWIPKLGVLERVKKALLTGVGLVVFFVSGVVALYYLVEPNVEKDLSLVALKGLFCFAVPIGLLTILGSFIWFSRRDATQMYFSHKLTEIIERSKKSK
jgi:hypothetical protein